jgi:EAL domain-containing protein (putative c-di-GMP-specific phosphodiesterase class I)
MSLTGPPTSVPDSGLSPSEKIQAVHDLIDKAQISVVFQPIVDLRTRKTYAYEALLRSRSSAFAGPPQLFEAAVPAGRVGELGRLHRQQAVSKGIGWPLFINVFPNEFDYGFLVRPDDPVFRHKQQVYLEVTESVPLQYFEQCHSVLLEVRKKGVFLAIDDLGAGYSNLKYILDLKPEIVKLDRELVAGASVGSRQYRLLKSLVRLCKDMGAKVVAEGIESVEELAVVEMAGADYCQGFLLSHPGSPPPEPNWPASMA